MIFLFDRSNMQIFIVKHNSGNIHDENLHIWAVVRKKIISRKLKYIFTKNYTKIIRTYWATKYESRRENEFWATCRNISNLFDGCWHPLLSRVLQCASTTLANSKYSAGYWWSHRILKSTVSMAFEHFVTCFVKHDEFLILNLSMLSQVEIKSRKRWASG